MNYLRTIPPYSITQLQQGQSPIHRKDYPSTLEWLFNTAKYIKVVGYIGYPRIIDSYDYLSR